MTDISRDKSAGAGSDGVPQRRSELVAEADRLWRAAVASYVHAVSLREKELWALHGGTFRNEAQVASSRRCGCFHCLAVFPPEAVVEWCDCDGQGGRTARCPECGIDSVIGDACGHEVDAFFLTALNGFAFGGRAGSMEDALKAALARREALLGEAEALREE